MNKLQPHDIQTQQIAVTSQLNAIAPYIDARFVIEAYATNKPDKGRISKRWCDLTLQEVINLLPELNALNVKGANIFFAVNEFNGVRKKENIARVRCAHADCDYVTEEKMSKIKAELPPTMIIQSSPDKYHLYWVTEGDSYFSVQEVESINKVLTRLIGADKAATDSTRLLRVAGFQNMKLREDGSKPIVQLIKFNGPRYTTSQLKMRIDSLHSRTEKAAIPLKPHESTQTTESQISQLCEMVKHDEPSLWCGDWKKDHDALGDFGYDSQSEVLRIT